MIKGGQSGKNVAPWYLMKHNIYHYMYVRMDLIHHMQLIQVLI